MCIPTISRQIMFYKSYQMNMVNNGYQILYFWDKLYKI